MPPQSSAFGDVAYPSIYQKAAALFEFLGQHLPFQNANKRTAFTALVTFLRYNDYRFSMDNKAAEDLTVDMVNHQYSFDDVAEIFRRHTVPID
ncbi:type II toxin-antitoxin system death-on-curing family toxin [Paenibacillus sp. V4I7]|uniref:type II toxin-antitoxin system death-on-curing family toxin n=1 Tax=Paenibacillus sp. V4I7 TaxID=3042307 RepID=UPI00277E61B4|nr:type II toxin-antitoxin system death-on-curing family toxin [Paenibacillus sp. V4I7]MDQ0902718.1 death-on-curing family protein [Paenibacillus sp. V4I7]